MQGCAAVSRAIRRWRRALAALLVDRFGAGAASFVRRARRGEGIRSLRGNWGDTRATRGQFWRAVGRGDGVDGAPTGRGAFWGLARKAAGGRAYAQHDEYMHYSEHRDAIKRTTNRAPRRPQPRPPPPHRACPRPLVQPTGSPRPNPWKQYRSTAATVVFSAGRRGCRRAPR